MHFLSFHVCTTPRFEGCYKILLPSLIYPSLVAVVCGKITVEVSGSPTTGVATPVVWSRNSSDPAQFVLQKILKGQPNPNNTGQVNVDSGGKLQGNVNVEFLFPGLDISVLLVPS